MSVLFRPSWWLQLFLSTIFTMLCIYLMKKAFVGRNVPIVSNVVEELS